MPLAQPATRTALHLLLVDDGDRYGPLLAEVATSRLGAATLQRTASLEAALDRLVREGADLVFLALGPDGSPGVAALDSLLATAAGAAVIILAAQGDENLVEETLGRGAQDCLVQDPLSVEAMHAAIRRALGRSRWQASLLKAEKRRHVTDRLLACTLDSMKAAIAIADSKGILVAANAPWQRKNLTPNPFIPPWEDRACDYAAFCRSLVAQAGPYASVAAGFLEVLTGPQARFVEDFYCGEGAETRGFGVTINRFQVDGEQHLGIAIADITARIQADQELLRAHAIKNLILENSTLGITFVRQRVFIWANARMAEILARPLHELLGAATRAIYPDQASYDEMGRATYPAMGRGERTDLTWQLRRGDGTLFWCRMIGRPLDRSAPEDGSVWLLEDITERIASEQERLSLEVQLRQAQKLEAIGQLAAGIAHEINTPTQYIGDNTKFLAGAFQDVFKYLDALEAGYGTNALPADLRDMRQDTDLAFLQDEIPKAIEQSMEGIDRVSSIVRAMKDFSHPGSDLPVEVDLNRSIESTVTVSRNEWKYVADLVLELDPDLGPVQCFPNEMNQVVLNLLVNAAHAIADTLQGDDPPKGTITVTTARCGDFAEIRIRDTGTGIPTEVRDRMFDPFFTTKDVGRGTGQGLAIVHSVVVERHHGTVTFDTEMGKGTVFILRIPMARALT